MVTCGCRGLSEIACTLEVKTCLVKPFDLAVPLGAVQQVLCKPLLAEVSRLSDSG